MFNETWQSLLFVLALVMVVGVWYVCRMTSEHAVPEKSQPQQQQTQTPIPWNAIQTAREKLSPDAYDKLMDELSVIWLNHPCQTYDDIQKITKVIDNVFLKYKCPPNRLIQTLEKHVPQPTFIDPVAVKGKFYNTKTETYENEEVEKIKAETKNVNTMLINGAFPTSNVEDKHVVNFSKDIDFSKAIDELINKQWDDGKIVPSPPQNNNAPNKIAMTTTSTLTSPQQNTSSPVINIGEMKFKEVTDMLVNKNKNNDNETKTKTTPKLIPDDEYKSLFQIFYPCRQLTAEQITCIRKILAYSEQYGFEKISDLEIPMGICRDILKNGKIVDRYEAIAIQTLRGEIERTQYSTQVKLEELKVGKMFSDAVDPNYIVKQREYCLTVLDEFVKEKKLGDKVEHKPMIEYFRRMIQQSNDPHLERSKAIEKLTYVLKTTMTGGNVK